MTPEELKYYTALQPKFREAMGAWQAGDRYCCPNDNRDRKIKIIEDGYFDSMQYDSEGKLGAWINPEPCCPDIALRLPLPIDRDNPERGLLGMLQNFRYLSNKRIVSPSYLCSTGAGGVIGNEDQGLDIVKTMPGMPDTARR